MSQSSSTPYLLRKSHGLISRSPSKGMASRNNTYSDNDFSTFYGWAASVVDITASAAAEIMGERLK